MAAGPAWITLLALLLGGGGSDLLDYIPPDAFWKQKQVQVSIESMSRELKPPPAATDVSRLIDDLNSPDAPVREQASQKLVAAGTSALSALREASRSPSPQIAASARGLIARIDAANRPTSVRRLMAIRALGEMQRKDAIAVLEPLLKSDEPFVFEYAREAIDQLNGKPVRRERPNNLRSDVWLLPDSCRAVGQLIAPTTGPISIKDAMRNLPLMPGQDPAAMQEQMTRMLVQAAEAVGNVRLDAMNFGVSGDIGENSGYVIAIARGRYDARAIADVLHKQQLPSHPIGGMEVFQPPGGESAIFFPSDQYAVAIGGPRGRNLPVEQVLDAIHHHQGKLKDVPEMKQLIDAAPPDQPLWAVMKVTPAYAQAPIFAPFDTVALGTTRTDKGIDLTFSGSGNHPEKAKAAADLVNAGAQQAVQELRRMQPFMPPMKVIADAMATVKCQPTGGNATLTAHIEGEQSLLLMLPMFGMSLHAEAGPATQPAQAQQALPPPQR